MITPTAPITVPAATADGLWISNINIQAPNTNKPVVAFIRITPYNTTTGEMFPALSKNITIPDVMQASTSNLSLATAMQAIFAAVQDQITTQSLF
jgi:hypothetical protein